MMELQLELNTEKEQKTLLQKKLEEVQVSPKYKVHVYKLRTYMYMYVHVHVQVYMVCIFCLGLQHLFSYCLSWQASARREQNQLQSQLDMVLYSSHDACSTLCCVHDQCTYMYTVCELHLIEICVCSALCSGRTRPRRSKIGTCIHVYVHVHLYMYIVYMYSVSVFCFFSFVQLQEEKERLFNESRSAGE